MRFQAPGLLWLLLLAFFLLGLVVRGHYRRKGLLRVSDVSALRAILPGGGRGRRLLLPRFLMVAALILMVVALARPQFGTVKEDIRKLGIDIFLAMDVSYSMAAEDLKPNRLEAAKTVIGKFLDRAGDNRVGMVIFAGKPMTLMPLSLDFGVLIDHLKPLRLEEIPYSGTNIGDALSMCVYHLEREQTKSKVVVLLTDGENNTGYADPLAAAKIAKEKGIKVYTVGVGSHDGAPIPVNTPMGKRYARDQRGELVIPKLDPVTLKSIAQYTGGRYFRATDEKTLEQIFEQIAQLEKSELSTSRTVLWSEQAHVFLILAFGLYMAAVLLEGGPMRRLE